MTPKLNFDTLLDKDFSKRLTAAQKENGGYITLNTYYRDVLGINVRAAQPSDQYKEIAENHYSSFTARIPMSPETVSKLTQNATEKNPIIIDGVCVVGHIEMKTGSPRRLVDTRNVSESYRLGSGRNIFTAPVKPVVFLSAGKLNARRPDLGSVQLLSTRLIPEFRESNPGYSGAIEESEFDAFVEFVLGQQAPTPTSKGSLVVTPSLKGCLADDAMMVVGAWATYYALRRRRAEGEPREKTPQKQFSTTFVGERVEELLKAAGRTFSFTMTWKRDGEGEVRSLFSLEQSLFIREWMSETGGAVEGRWVREAQRKFPVSVSGRSRVKQVCFWAVGSYAGRVARVAGEEAMLGVLRRHPAVAGKPHRSVTRFDEPLKLSDLLYRREDAEAIFAEWDKLVYSAQRGKLV